MNQKNRTWTLPATLWLAIIIPYQAWADGGLRPHGIDSQDPRWQQAMQRGLEGPALDRTGGASPASPITAIARGGSADTAEFLREYTRQRLPGARPAMLTDIGLERPHLYGPERPDRPEDPETR